MMKSEAELKQILNNKGFDIYEASTTIDEDTAMQLVSLEELIRFALKHSVDSLFYRYHFIDADDLCIDEEVVSKLRFDEDVISAISNKIERYNEDVCRLDYEKAVALSVYCVFQGFVYFIHDMDYWFIDQGFDMPETAAIQFANDNLDEIISLKEDAKTKILEGRQELRNEMLNDPNFQKCTNVQLRRAYGDRLFRNDENKQRLFYRKKGGMYDITINSFIEEVWREYKASINKS